MLHVLLETPSPRARYVVRHVFERMLGCPVVFIASREELAGIDGPTLSYGALPVHGAFHVPASGWLVKSGIPKDIPPEGTFHGERVLFPEGEGFDLFAAVFFFIGLLEEQTLTDRDEHDRVPAKSLWAVRHGMEQRPFVDAWVLDLAGRLRQRWPALPLPERAFTHVLTVDMDNGLKYAGRPLSRALGASARDLLRGDFTGLVERWRTRFGAADSYAHIVAELATAAPIVDRIIAFVLTQGNGPFDHAADIDHPAYRALIADLSRVAEIGLHPSYESSRSASIIPTEKQRLMRTAAKPCTLSRQHFLRWRLPGTLRQLIAESFTEDHSIGFSDRAGFRAGTCTPFTWYDLERDAETPLLMVPFAVMDSALREREGVALDDALQRMMTISDAVRQVQGTFVSVWHDRYLSGHREFAGGPQAMMRLVNHARS